MHIHPSISSVFLRLPSSSRDINHISAIARRRLARRRVRSSSLPRPLERIPRHASVVPTSLLESHAPHRRRSRRHRFNTSDIIRASAGHRGERISTLGSKSHCLPTRRTTAWIHPSRRARPSPGTSWGARSRSSSRSRLGARSRWASPRGGRRVRRQTSRVDAVAASCDARSGRIEVEVGPIRSDRSIDRGVPNVRRVVGCVVVKWVEAV